eukprot:3889626-Amphidinium_carterae.1
MFLDSHMWLLAQGVKLKDRDGKTQRWDTINLYVMNDYLVKPLTWRRQVCANSSTTIRKNSYTNQRFDKDHLLDMGSDFWPFRPQSSIPDGLLSRRACVHMSRRQVSFVELVATQEQIPRWFISHYWGTKFEQSLRTLSSTQLRIQLLVSRFPSPGFRQHYQSKGPSKP